MSGTRKNFPMFWNYLELVICFRSLSFQKLALSLNKKYTFLNNNRKGFRASKKTKFYHSKLIFESAHFVGAKKKFYKFLKFFSSMSNNNKGIFDLFYKIVSEFEPRKKVLKS